MPKKQNLRALIPSKVRITRNVEYEVLFSVGLGEDFCGECRSGERQIVLNPNRADSDIYKTYLHELFHAFSFEYEGMNLTEKQVRLLEEAFYRYERLNKII